MPRHQGWLVVVVVAALIGAVFAAISTYDFVQHLDRQVHNLHCSFIPGVTHTGESGCQVAMMSPYSSVFRGRVWGGVPIALPALSVFAFLAFYALDLLITRRKADPRATGFLALAAVLPAATSLLMLTISLSVLGTTCKLCVCIYLASAACLIGAIGQWRRARSLGGGAAPAGGSGAFRRDEPAFVGRAKTATASGAQLVAVSSGNEVRPGFLAAMFAIGVGFVLVPVVLYLAMAPDHARFIGSCEALPKADDPYGVLLRVDRAAAGAAAAPAIEVLDPLCPACKAFEQRLAGSGLAGRLDRKAVLFPLDNTCNWMVTEATHPGACTVSEAVLCAGDRAPDVLAWAFEVQDQVRNETAKDPTAAARMVKARFPELASCLGSPEARSRLNKSLRWIVSNNIRVLTPQLFVDKVKLCDEDVDLGLEYMLSTMLERRAHGGLTAGKPAGAADKAEKSDKPEKADKAAKQDKPERADTADKAAKADKAEKSDKPEKTEKAENADRSEKTDSGDKPEKSGKEEKSDSADKPEKSDSADKPEKSGSADKPEKPRKQEKQDEQDNQPVTRPGGSP